MLIDYLLWGICFLLASNVILIWRLMRSTTLPECERCKFFDGPLMDEAAMMDFEPVVEVCPHGFQPVHCEACFQESDFQYDCHQERRLDL